VIGYLAPILINTPYISVGKTRRLLWESEDDKTPQRVHFSWGGLSRAHGKRSVFPKRWQRV